MPRASHSRRYSGPNDQSWKCIAISYPLIKVITGFTVVDVIRGFADTIHIVGLLFILVKLDYEDVKLSASEVVSTSGTYVASRNYFIYNRDTLAVILGLGVVVFAAEIPLAVLLYKGIHGYNPRNCTLWLQFTAVILFFNIVTFGGIAVYSEKAGVIRDDLFTQTHASKFMTYSCLLRGAVFDLFKGAEMLFVGGYLRELKRRPRIMNIPDGS